MEAKHCLLCGQVMIERDVDGTMRRACPDCTYVHWGNYSVGVGALVKKEGKLLLVRRAQNPGKGYWTNPGGYIEQLEPIGETVCREVLEETGVRATVRSVVAIRDLPRAIHNLYIAFAMDYVEGEPVADGLEVDAAGFFSLEEMETMNVAPFTRWLADVAAGDESGEGLQIDTDPVVPLNGLGLFRLQTK
ncbi:NUDIX domain-containing protein [Paenibacillus beijingensis]|uniref:NUDIX hydrolase n=1 Tax=Paenibacillus beijingensis TaxID=1126833 RepID=A0A0D5NL76_9BACL|nr:NUDIX domain-containing protein [Paenibacillus beijingensis]AJY75658.1 NUDIX hydrolase [Paenibacillus beijingensis]